MRHCLLAAVLLAALSVGGCGEDEAPPSPVGTWVIDLEHYAEHMLEFTKDMPGAPKDGAYFKQAAQIEVEFHADGTWESTGVMDKARIEETGVWTLAGGQLLMEWKTRGGKDAPVWEQKCAYDGSVIEVSPEINAPFALRLVRK